MPRATRDPRLRQGALRFVVLIGVVSLFSDMTYEAARGINGPYLAVLGASAFAVGFVSGGAELLGYLVRLVSGYGAGRTGRYWLWTGVGYVINLLAAPALALAGNWQMAMLLIVAERIGKGIRNPPRDTMLSHAGSVIGQGWAFALREGLDQTGAMVGPLIVALILFLRSGSFRLAYGWLVIPAGLSLVVLVFSRRRFPNPRSLEQDEREQLPDRVVPPARGFPKAYWLYLGAMGLMALGYADFNLVSYHLAKGGAATGVIALLYTLAMGVSAISALLFGRWFDRRGAVGLIVAALVAALFAPFVFAGNLIAATAGVVLWGVGMGIQDSLMSAPVSIMIPAERRANALGIFNAIYGSSWFVGSSLLGFLYGLSVPALVAFSIAAGIAAVLVLIIMRGPLDAYRRPQTQTSS